ncbi:MAG: bifunctional phosphopantothenoylcysteine decarboxylase/phosphopantothenate--cysteine ligase CoaBC [Cytophagaceae bacterium]|nr:bifunctional phosphopantothenoylcysteine decarboxylase/phosphopantothenate--cysteine ligase CoaBC [Cytophagaceae bacterium]
MLQGKKILLGVTGSIAAYKSAYLIRYLIKEEAEVQVVMTPSASEFISSLTLSTLSKKPVYTEFVKDNLGQWNNHVDLALWADLIIIAPASANTVGKMANGITDNLLSAVYLSAKCPVWVAPAMDLDMYAHPSTKENIDKLKSFGNTIIDAEHGELASGLVGTGRMAEPETIVKNIRDFFLSKSRLKGKKVIVTAGPTYEPIDPVRFIGNHSSGKMGYELAAEMAKRGAEVFLISGPTQIAVPANVKIIKVKTAAEMYEEVNKIFSQVDIAVLAAAVADYAPEKVADKKIKKQEGEMEIKLSKTIDIAAELGKKKKNGQIIVGFALETDNELENAQTKLKNKNFDMIVLNSLNEKGAGFGYDTNKITIISRDNKIVPFELKSKKEVASDIVNAIVERLHV